MGEVASVMASPAKAAEVAGASERASRTHRGAAELDKLFHEGPAPLRAWCRTPRLQEHLPGDDAGGVQGYGITYLAERDGKPYAVKRSKGKTMGEVEDMFQEAMRMSEVKHERLVRIEDMFIETDGESIRLNLVLEYCSGGDLRTLLKQPNKPTENETSHIVACVAEGLAYMHRLKPPMVHCDVKPANIWLCPGALGSLPNAKLGDFSLARRDTGSSQYIVGSRFYMSPDAWEARQANSMSILWMEGNSPAADVWALGRVAAELATGELAREMITTQSQVDRLLEGIPRGDISERFRETLRDMLEITGARATAGDVARHIRGSGVDFTALAASSTDFMVLEQARQSAAAVGESPTTPAWPATPSTAASSTEHNLAPEAWPKGGAAGLEPEPGQGPAGNANAAAGGGQDADREALRTWLREKAKVGPKSMDEVLRRCEENHIWTVAHAEMMQEDGSLQDILPEQSLEDWLSTVANVDPRSLEWAVEACKAKRVFTVSDIIALSKAQLQDVFGKNVIRIQVAKAIGRKDSVSDPGNSSGSTAHGGTSAGAPQFPGEGGKYRRMRDLGEGSYGVTYLAEKDGKEYAVKRSKGKSELDEVEHMFQEARRMSEVKHERLVRIEDLFLEKDGKSSIRLNLVLEYCSGGDLLSRLKRPPKPVEEEASHIVACVADGLAYMHGQDPPMVHRDIKPANILLCPGATGRPPNAKLGDFGLARRATGSIHIIAGSRFYMCPDAFEAASAASDVWALGRVGAELAAGELAKLQLTTQSQVDELLGEIPKADLSEGFCTTLQEMLHMQPAARPTARDVARHLMGIGDDPSSLDITAVLRGLVWMQPCSVPGLQWEQEPNGVKRCTFSPACCTDPEAMAQRHMLDLINLTPCNRGFIERYAKQITSTVLSKSTIRAMGFVGTCRKLSSRYSKMANFSLESQMGEQSTAQGRWRRRVLDHLEQQYPSLCAEASVSNVRIRTAFHATRGMDSALDILNGGFASLKVTDPGFIGDGIYVTLDAEYALQEYGQGVEVPLIVCAVVCGNPYPVIENHVLQPNDNFLGKALVAKADAHVAVMARDPMANYGHGEPLPCPPEKWEQLELLTEMALPEAQVLPLGVLLVRQR